MKNLNIGQHDFIRLTVSGKWSINPNNGLIDVDGSVDLTKNRLNNISSSPVNFGKITGDFKMNDNYFTTLEGCPYWVGGNFDCSVNFLTSLKYAPDYIGGDCIVFFNNIRNIDWSPNYVGGELYFDLSDSHTDFHCIIIPEIEKLIERGIKLMSPETCYYPYMDVYYERKMIELL